ncbi:MAG: carboxymuconolactone decarboxylase family protein [Pirellulales bacterium]
MSRIQAIAPEQATGKAKELLDAVGAKLGLVPNMARAMANSPAVLDGYLGLSGALAKGTLSARVREQIALTVGQRNHCDYCLAAHSTIGKMSGLTEEQILDSRHGKAIDSKTDAVLRLAGLLVDNRGRVSDRELDEARAAGLNDATIAEVVGAVALNIFTNYFNHVAETEIDFPKAAPLSIENEACNVGEACCSSQK